MRNSFKKVDAVKAIILDRKDRLEGIVYSKKPSNKDLVPAHERRVRHAAEYLKELEQLESELVGIKELDIVPEQTLNNQLDGADYCSMIVDAEKDGRTHPAGETDDRKTDYQ